jgi:hypothetical protein
LTELRLDMPVRIAVIAEADVDRRQVCELVDRKIKDHAPDWWDAEQIEAEREYCGLVPATFFTRWTELRDLPTPEGALRRGGLIGFGERQRLHFDYPLGRKALLSCTLAKPRVDAVILIRDMDQQPEDRTASLTQARDEIPGQVMRVVLALPRAKREAWVLNGFDPRGANEGTLLAALREELGFDPRMRAENLDAMEHGAKRDAKRVLHHLIGKDHEREASCWRDTPWSSLRERGVGSGLVHFLVEVKERLVPLVTGRPV